MDQRKKDLIRAYKDTPTPMGVFQIKNTCNGKVFITSSTNLPGLINRHRFQLTMGGHPNKMLQEDWIKAGPDSFTFDILETIKPESVPKDKWRETATLLEEKWVEKLQPFDNNGYHKQKEVSKTSY